MTMPFIPSRGLSLTQGFGEGFGAVDRFFQGRKREQMLDAQHALEMQASMDELNAARIRTGADPLSPEEALGGAHVGGPDVANVGKLRALRAQVGQLLRTGGYRTPELRGLQKTGLSEQERLTKAQGDSAMQRSVFEANAAMERQRAGDEAALTRTRVSAGAQIASARSNDADRGRELDLRERELNARLEDRELDNLNASIGELQRRLSARPENLMFEMGLSRQDVQRSMQEWRKQMNELATRRTNILLGRQLQEQAGQPYTSPRAQGAQAAGVPSGFSMFSAGESVGVPSAAQLRAWRDEALAAEPARQAEIEAQYQADLQRYQYR